jgi:hypothetical protein
MDNECDGTPDVQHDRLHAIYIVQTRLSNLVPYLRPDLVWLFCFFHVDEWCGVRKRSPCTERVEICSSVACWAKDRWNTSREKCGRHACKVIIFKLVSGFCGSVCKTFEFASVEQSLSYGDF